MYSNKKKTTVGFPIFVNEASPSADYKYGPYDSVQEAFDYLGEDGLDVLCVGLTIGIRNADGSITEYWFEKGCASVDDLVEKRGMRGESAYDIAVRHGFEGTEAEWLESIGAAQNALVEKYEELRQENELLKQKLDEQEALNAEQQDEIDRLKNYDQTQDENLDAATKLATSEAVRGLFSK